MHETTEKRPEETRVVVGMSGGVDSSVATLFAETARLSGYRHIHEKLG